jgi:Fur family ferric uptake transcriptional regulator
VEWEGNLAAAGYRITASRRAVMRVLTQTDVPLSPQEIFERARRVHRRLGLVSVYRTLDLFSELDMVRRVHRQDDCHGYLLASPGHRHALICQRCGRAVEFPGEDDLQDLVGRVEAATGYRVEGHLLQLFGLCPDCQSVKS